MLLLSPADPNATKVSVNTNLGKCRRPDHDLIKRDECNHSYCTGVFAYSVVRERSQKSKLPDLIISHFPARCNIRGEDIFPG